MNLQTNVETITEQTQLFQGIAIILLVVAIALFIASIVIFIVFNIPHSFRVLTGMGMNKEMSRAASGERKRAKATLSWGSSDNLNKNAAISISSALNNAEEDATTLLADEETTLLSNGDDTTVLNSDETTVLGCDETTVLGCDETTVLDSDETTVLTGINDIFQMEDDIKITGSNMNI
ncbi:hypothetical protein SAMN05421493_11245 [Pseudobutyrivibrio sp. 49]|uniref:hypothetical protein n=1 Tax=Pseudobutyrivibrio sp. 49 TaxID=1855344 RepID=UPI000885D820|nr:hypothetical protein [Pseudobutyrivibrio sp. 49]SDI35738.1 hypothetical protein SAMN05421493_11245 [Pseudobutyrivibrio sp. 49]